VSAEVDPHLEGTEITDRAVKAGGPALLFENPKGSSHPLLINQFGTERRMCMAFGVERLDDVAAKLEDVLEMQPPQGLVDKVRGLKKLKTIADSLPQTARRGPAQEIVVTGDDVDLGALPVQTCWPGDAAPFITLPAVITEDPRTGTRNVGMYRMQVLDRATTAMHWQIHKDGRADYLATDGRIEVAVALGLDPVTTYSASAPLPKHIDEFMLAGFLRGEPVQLLKGKTVDLDVPANAEIVLEGYIDKDELTAEGPFGDHTGFYTAAEPFPVFHVTAVTMLAGFLPGEPVQLLKGKTVDLDVPANAEIVLEGYIDKDELTFFFTFGAPTEFYTAAEPFPVFHVTAVTMREDAIYPSIVVGKPPAEDAWLGKATERIFLPAVRMTVPEIVDYDLPIAGVFHNCCIVSIRKAFPGHAKKVMHAIWGLGMLSLTKAVAVVDAHVDVHDYRRVFFYVGANVDPRSEERRV